MYIARSTASPVWSSQLAVYLGTIGAAVGLGSIWRFPYLAGTLGGGVFIGLFLGGVVAWRAAGARTAEKLACAAVPAANTTQR